MPTEIGRMKWEKEQRQKTQRCPFFCWNNEKETLT